MAGTHKPQTALIFLDDEPLHVPRTVSSHWAARGVLGIPRGSGVARASDPTQALSFLSGHAFEDNERYVTVTGAGLFENFPSAERDVRSDD